VKTLSRPLRAKPVQLADGSSALASDGAPSDCVALAVMGVIEEPIDLVVSGINTNANIGHDVTYSGTVTAAMEAVISGIQAISFSLDAPEYHSGPLDYSTAAVAARRVSEAMVAPSTQECIVKCKCAISERRRDQRVPNLASGDAHLQ
jgi:5'-nucleotidase